MRIIDQGVGLLVLACMLQPAWARLTDDSDRYWQCTSRDSQAKEWVVQSPYQRVATNKALAACKQASQLPISCRVAKEYCESYVGGVSTQPMWVCTALDFNAKPWVSNVYSQQDDAALAALAYCKEKSAFPDSCYMDLVTCRNRNEKASQ